MHLGPVAVVDRLLPEQLHVERIVVGRGRVVAQLGVLDDQVAHVDAEAVDAAVEPEPQDVVELVAHVLVPPVQVGLLDQVVVHVVLAGALVERPAPGRRSCSPSCSGGEPSGFGIGPDVPVAVRGVRDARALDEPRVLIARVVGDEVEQDPDAALVRARDELVEVGERTEISGCTAQ